MKVGSMFAGIGGFDLGFERAGFEIAWCIEWDKAAQSILRRHFPKAKIYGDISQLDGSELEQVDVVCGGFPCQDLSVAGKRAGLAGARSGLFYDAMRIVKRLNPSVLILENVPGLLSSNHGLDFATVLREVGQGWDCAEVGWRVLDSQYFGVAQRRRRVFVVAGSRIGCAESILALAEVGGGDPPSRGATRKDAAGDAARCFAGSRESDIAATLETTANDYSRADSFQHIVGALDCDIPKQRAQNAAQGHYIAVAIQGNLIGRDSGGPQGVGASESGTMYTLTRADVHGVAFPIQDGRAMEKIQNGIGVGAQADPSYTLDTTGSQAVAFRKSKRAQSADDDETWVDDGLANTLNGFDTGDARTTHAVAHTIDMQACKGNANVGDGRVSPTLCKPSGNDVHAVAITQGVDVYNGVETGQVAATVTSATGGSNTSGPKVSNAMTVRRLTPTECERLQGFPDGWTAEQADTHRYKQLGNAVTVNVTEWIANNAKSFLHRTRISDADPD